MLSRANAVERLRRLWVRSAPDHPLTEQERAAKPPATAAEESARTTEGVFGESLGPKTDGRDTI